MSLTESRVLRSLVLCLLYFAQGFPWGFATVALLALFTAAGHPKEETATIVTLAILPWTFKFLWAPLIDSFRWPTLGFRRPWIIIAQFGMALTLFGTWSLGEFEDLSSLHYLAWVFFVHNCFASLQDVSTDGLAVDLLDDTERGRVNGFMWGSKLLGKGVGGAGMAVVLKYHGVGPAVLIQAGTVLAILCLVVLVRERPGEKRFPWSAGSAQVEQATAMIGNVFGIARELLRALAVPTAALGLVLAFSTQLCEGLFRPLTAELFVQELGWTALEYSNVQGLWGTGGELVGALLGGYLCDRHGRRRMLGVGMAVVSATFFGFAFTADHWHREWYPAFLMIPLFTGALACATVSFFSLAMKISWTRAAATQFTLYMTMCNIGDACGARLNRANYWITDGIWCGTEGSEFFQAWLSRIDWGPLDTPGFYLLAGSVSLAPFLVLPFMRPDTVVARRDAER